MICLTDQNGYYVTDNSSFSNCFVKFFIIIFDLDVSGLVNFLTKKNQD